MEEVTESVGQSVIDGALHWYRSGARNDGVHFEEDGIGLPPECIRNRLIEKGGEWDVVVEESVSKPVVVSVMRKAMQLDIASAARLLKNLPGVVYTGTKAEAGWIKVKLQEVAVTAEIRARRGSRLEE